MSILSASWFWRPGMRRGAGGRAATVASRICVGVCLCVGASIKEEDMAMQHQVRRDPRRELLRRLGDKVRSFRHERGLTQEALADSLQFSVAYVSLIERGGRNPPFTTVVEIAHALGVSPQDLCE